MGDERDFGALISDYFDDEKARARLDEEHTRPAACLVADFGGAHRRAERYGVAYALALQRAAEQAFCAVFELFEPATLRRGRTLLAVFERTETALMAAFDGLTALNDFNGRRVDPAGLSIGLGFGELLIDPGNDAYGVEADRAALLAHAGALGGVLLTDSFVAALREPTFGIGIHKAPKDKIAALGLAFHVARDYR